MPVIQISLVEGRTPQQLRTMIGDVAGAVSRALEAPIDTVKVIVTEIPSTHWGSGDHTIAEKRGEEEKQ